MTDHSKDTHFRWMVDKMAAGAVGRFRNNECHAYKIALSSSRHYHMMLIPVMTFAPC